MSGQDGDQAALNRVALGTQTVSVWKDCARARQGGRRDRRRRSPTAPRSTRSRAPRKFTTPGGNEMNAILLTPIPITKDNLDVVIDAGWITKDELCAGVAGRRRRLQRDRLTDGRRSERRRRFIRTGPPTRHARRPSGPRRAAPSPHGRDMTDTRIDRTPPQRSARF